MSTSRRRRSNPSANHTVPAHLKLLELATDKQHDRGLVVGAKSLLLWVIRNDTAEVFPTRGAGAKVTARAVGVHLPAERLKAGRLLVPTQGTGRIVQLRAEGAVSAAELRKAIEFHGIGDLMNDEHAAATLSYRVRGWRVVEEPGLARKLTFAMGGPSGRTLEASSAGQRLKRTGYLFDVIAQIVRSGFVAELRGATAPRGVVPGWYALDDATHYDGPEDASEQPRAKLGL